MFPFYVENTSGEKLKLTCNLIAYCIKVLILTGSFLLCQYIICVERTVDLSLQEIVFNTCSFYTSFVLFFLNINNFKIRKSLQKGFLKYENTAEEISKITVDRITRDPYINQIIVIEILYLSISWAYMFIIYYYFYDFVTGTLFLVGFTLPKFLVTSFNFIHYTLLLKEQYYAINNHIKNQLLNENDLKRLADVYFKLGRLTKKINNLHGYQNLIILTKYYVWIVFEMYHFFLLASQENIPWSDVKLMIFGFTWSATQLIAAGSLLTISGVSKQEADKFGSYWGNSLAATNSDNLVRCISYIIWSVQIIF